jgi:hypothetical protein
VFGEGTGLGRRYDGEPIRGGLAGDDAADVGRMLADRVAGVRLGLDPVDERGEPAVRAIVLSQPTKFQRNGLGHETVSAFPAPFGRLIERSCAGQNRPYWIAADSMSENRTCKEKFDSHCPIRYIPAWRRPPGRRPKAIRRSEN